MLTVGSLFAGIGGIESGLERTGGFQTVWQVEIDEYATKVLEKRWPNARRWKDIRTFPSEPIEEWKVDVITGGFPCQEISIAGNGVGLAGDRSGLWWDMLRCVRVLKPQFVIIENVAELIVIGLPAILSSLAEVGYDAEWATLSARQFGAVHRRQRVFVVAYPAGVRWTTRGNRMGLEEDYSGWKRFPETYSCQNGWDVQRWIVETYSALGFPPGDSTTKRVVDGIPNRLDRLRVLGNSVLPRIGQWIGKRILSSFERRGAECGSTSAPLPQP